MNRRISYVLYVGFISLLFISCDKDGFIRYDRERVAIEFYSSSNTYTFRKTFNTVDTVDILFNLVGYPEDRERHAEFIIVPDSTTASDYQIVDAIMNSGAYHGNLRVRVENKVGDGFQDVRVYFEIAHGKDFIPGLDEKKICVLNLTNKLIRPVSWAVNSWNEKNLLGTYSTVYYQFVIEVTGETEFPYPRAVSGYNNHQAWSVTYKDAILGKLKNELKARNKREGSLLLHDDGPAKGKEVVIGRYYQN